MENPEEILHSLEEFSKFKPKDIPRELEDYLCFVAKTGDPVYQWSAIKSLFREKLISVITEFYESCPTVEIPPCPNVDLFNYESMKNFILEKLDTFAAAPFTVQRICELLTTPRKEYNRVDKYMRALEKNILVVSTTEPGNRRTSENGEGIVNGIESEHVAEASNSSNDINVEEMDDSPSWPRLNQMDSLPYQNSENNIVIETHTTHTKEITLSYEDGENIVIETQSTREASQETFIAEAAVPEATCSSSVDISSSCKLPEQQPYVSIEPVVSDSCPRQETIQESDVTVTITAIPAAVQKRRDSIEPVISSEATTSQIPETNKLELQETKSECTAGSDDVQPDSGISLSPLESTTTTTDKSEEVKESISTDHSGITVSSTSDTVLQDIEKTSECGSTAETESSKVETSKNTTCSDETITRIIKSSEISSTDVVVSPHENAKPVECESSSNTSTDLLTSTEKHKHEVLPSETSDLDESPSKNCSNGNTTETINPSVTNESSLAEDVDKDTADSAESKEDEVSKEESPKELTLESSSQSPMDIDSTEECSKEEPSTAPN